MNTDILFYNKYCTLNLTSMSSLSLPLKGVFVKKLKRKHSLLETYFCEMPPYNLFIFYRFLYFIILKKEDARYSEAKFDR